MKVDGKCKGQQDLLASSTRWHGFELRIFVLTVVTSIEWTQKVSIYHAMVVKPAIKILHYQSITSVILFAAVAAAVAAIAYVACRFCISVDFSKDGKAGDVIIIYF